MGFFGRTVCAMILTAALGLALVNRPALAPPVGYTFDAVLQTGPLAGTFFSGSLSYDNAEATGIGQEFLALTSLDFTLLGASFTLANITQGGQAILEDGVLSFFTAVFFLPSLPINSPVSDIAFDGGVPGVIGYTTPPDFSNFGSGEYTLHRRVIPAPSSLAFLALGLGALAAATNRRMILDRGWG